MTDTSSPTSPTTPTTPAPPSGEQHRLEHGDYRAVVTEAGAGLRVLEHRGRPLVDGYAEDEQASGGRGQVLMPWPNRIRDGRYTFDGDDQQLPLTEVARGHASHGLVRWASWTVRERAADAVTLGCRVPSQPGYPWVLDLEVTWALTDDGLHVTQRATNRSGRPAPYACGAHPYLVVGDGPVDGWELSLPAATRATTDERLIPVGREPVTGTAYDFTTARAVGDVELNDAFTDLGRRDDDTVEVVVRDPATGRGTVMWGGPAVRWFQLYTADDRPATARRSLACEPMTANANAFATGEDLLVLAPAGEPGDTASVTWGLRAVDEPA